MLKVHLCVHCSIVTAVGLWLGVSRAFATDITPICTPVHDPATETKYQLPTDDKLSDFSGNLRSFLKHLDSTDLQCPTPDPTAPATKPGDPDGWNSTGCNNTPPSDSSGTDSGGPDCGTGHLDCGNDPTSGTTGSRSVPEPAGAAMMATAGFGILRRRRRIL